jgi:hypothetical protein
MLPFFGIIGLRPQSLLKQRPTFGSLQLRVFATWKIKDFSSSAGRTLDKTSEGKLERDGRNRNIKATVKGT